MIKKMIVFFILIMGMSKSVFAEGQAAPSQSSLSRGRQLFMKNCASCHGRDGRGDTPMGRAIQTTPDLASPSMKNKSDQELFDTITQGKAPMPSFQHLSEEDRWNLVNFIRTLAGVESQ